jgi:hypothetical protein
MADSVDPQVRLQSIALEHAELIARRQMSWSESTNRAAMFMTVLGAAVVGLALIAQTLPVRDVAFVALLVFSIVLLIGLTSWGRIAALDLDDIRWIQGLNRLRHLRLELDPGLAPYLVTSPHDDFDSVLQAYGPEDAPPTTVFFTLAVLLIFINGLLGGVVAALVAVQLGWDAPATVLTGVVAAVLVVLGLGVWMYREAAGAGSRFMASVVVPAPAARPGGSPTSKEPPQPS